MPLSPRRGEKLALLEPVSLKVRAVFEPHWVRTDHMPGDTNLMNAGLVRTFDTDTNPPTFFFNRGDERKPDTNRLMHPDVPKAFGGSQSRSSRAG